MLIENKEKGMAVKLKQISKWLKEDGLKHKLEKKQNRIILIAGNYVDSQLYIIDLAEKGEMFSWKMHLLDSDTRPIKIEGHQHVGKVLEYVLFRNYITKFGSWEYDYHDGDLCLAVEIPLEDASADFLSITYGIRNVVERQAAFDEFNRVLKKEGLVVILEFMKDENKNILKKLRDIYMHKILPYVGGAISKNLAAYTYLPDSIENFVTIQGMQKELEDAGFEILHTQSFSMDISTLMIARKK